MQEGFDYRAGERSSGPKARKGPRLESHTRIRRQKKEKIIKNSGVGLQNRAAGRGRSRPKSPGRMGYPASTLDKARARHSQRKGGGHLLGRTPTWGGRIYLKNKKGIRGIVNGGGVDF